MIWIISPVFTLIKYNHNSIVFFIIIILLGLEHIYLHRLSWEQEADGTSSDFTPRGLNGLFKPPEFKTIRQQSHDAFTLKSRLFTKPAMSQHIYTRPAIFYGPEHCALSPLLMTCDPKDKLLTELQSCSRRLMPTWSVTFRERAIFLLLFFFGLFFKLRDFQIAAVSESDDSDDGPNYEPLHH